MKKKQIQKINKLSIFILKNVFGQFFEKERKVWVMDEIAEIEMIETVIV